MFYGDHILRPFLDHFLYHLTTFCLKTALLTALKHDSMNEAEQQAKDFIEQINEVLDEVEKRN